MISTWDTSTGSGRGLDNAPLSWSKLMPRPKLERWLYSHFLRSACQPSATPTDDSAPVYAPLNLTAFLGLVAHLHGKGYPTHWLATTLENLTSGRVNTTARAPRRDVLDVSWGVDAVHPPRQISVAPWTAEFTTLLGIFWTRLMPFGFAVAQGILFHRVSRLYVAREHAPSRAALTCWCFIRHRWAPFLRTSGKSYWMSKWETRLRGQRKSGQRAFTL